MDNYFQIARRMKQAGPEAYSPPLYRPSGAMGYNPKDHVNCSYPMLCRAFAQINENYEEGLMSTFTEAQIHHLEMMNKLLNETLLWSDDWGKKTVIRWWERNWRELIRDAIKANISKVEMDRKEP